MKIIISPYSRGMRNGKLNPKNFPYWKEVINLLIQNGHEVIQVGVEGEEGLVSDFRKGLSLDKLKELINECDTWISVDNFFNHLANHTSKIGIVIFGMSDPKIYGYPQNINLLKDRKYLREKQYDIWECCEFDENVFVKPEAVLKAVNKLKGKNGS
jgi:ADP-heptose:LPS heptosyltransferase